MITHADKPYAAPTEPIAIPRPARRVPVSLVFVVALLALFIALSHIGAATQGQAVAWAFAVGAVIALIRVV